MGQTDSLLKRRWRVFKAHRRGYASAIILACLFVALLPAELICNNRPLFVSFGGRWLFPIVHSYAETTFGGTFDTEADYLDPAVLKMIAAGDGRVVFPPVTFDYAYIDTSLSHPAPSPPDSQHLLGTDDRGRDVLARLIYGFRLSLLFGLLLALFGSAVGVLIGALQGYFGGTFDLLFQRLCEVWSSQNELFLLIILSSIFEPSLGLIFVLLSLFGWMGLAAYVRAEFLRMRQVEYVQAAVAMGSTRLRVITKHILPNAMMPVITFFPFRLAEGIMGLTALDFLSLGVPAPTPSLGELLNQGKSNLTSWWIITSVFVVIITLITLLNFIGEAVQKAFDPRAVG